MRIINYDLNRFDFRPWAEAVLGTDSLSNLHNMTDLPKFSNYVDKLQYHLKKVLEGAPLIQGLYNDFMMQVVGPEIGGLNVYQSPFPSFRLHLSGGGTVSSFHRDGDKKYDVRPYSLNVWVPLTPARGTNSLFIEKTVGANDFIPVELNPGQCLLFDAFHLTHGSRANSTDQTRMSFDARFVPQDPSCSAAMTLYARSTPTRFK